MLDNLTISKRIDFGADKTIKDAVVSFNATRPFIMTSYTGTDPSPELYDALGGGDETSGTATGGAALLAPGIDRREDYFASKSFALGLKLNF